MRVQLVSIAPTQAAEVAGRPALTPELLAATGARYSRNNEGLEAILARIDPQRPEASVDSIFRMIDYGHQSIADMAPVAMFIDRVSILLAYLVWAWSPQAGGQESSTRYIRMKPSGLIDPERLGIPRTLQSEWCAAMQASFDHYKALEHGWQRLSDAAPEHLRIPDELLNDTDPKIANQVRRIRRNYAFDRARYCLPAAAATNLMLVMSARAWATLCQHLRSCTLPEAQSLGKAIHDELAHAVPHLMRHATAKPSFEKGLRQEFEALSAAARTTMPATLEEGTRDAAHPATASLDLLLPPEADAAALTADLLHHDNRYAWLGPQLRRTAIRFGWEAVAFGDIRDLNRHRTGTKHCPLVPCGFYCAIDQLPAADDPSLAQAPEAALRAAQEFGRRLTRRSRELLAAGDPTCIYWTLLGTQFPFEHTTTADKFIYEAELRTGTGAHYRYARHLRDALELWYSRFPQTRGLITEGGAEPE